MTVVAGIVSAQLTPPPLKFEVASVKPADPAQRSTDLRMSGNRLTITNLTLKDMVRWAYDMRYDQLSGGVSWWESDRFNIEATAAREASQPEFRLMLQSLLGERFQLQVRHMTREGTVYSLVVGKGGFNLKESASTESWLRLYRNTPPELPGVSYTIGGQKVTMARLAAHLSGTLQAPVKDLTGIQREYDFKIPYGINDPDAGPSILISIQEQLGLKLEASKGEVEFMVVDHAEKPTSN
jgi:uncharacterized protein (TIGR03435 family)